MAVNKKGLMDQDMMSAWLTKCYIKRPDIFFKTRSALLVIDSRRAHTTPQSKDKIEAFNAILVMIPGGLTKILQPLDISMNQSVKAVLCRLWEEWIVDGEDAPWKFPASHCMDRQSMGISDNWNHLVRTRMARITGAAAESDNSSAEEKTAFCVPLELAELFRSDMEDEEFNGWWKLGDHASH